MDKMKKRTGKQKTRKASKHALPSGFEAYKDMHMSDLFKALNLQRIGKALGRFSFSSLKEMTLNNKMIAIVVVLFIMFQLFYVVSLFESRNSVSQPETSNSTAYSAYSHITGRAVTDGSLNLFLLPSTDCQIDLSNNWNLFSMCSDVPNKSISNILSTINGDYEYLLEWNTSSQNFNAYSIHSSQNGFDKLNDNSSYFIFMRNPRILSIVGDQFEDKNVSVDYQWSTPSYPYTFTANITRYLETMPNQYDYMYKWNNTMQKFLVWSKASSIKPFTVIYRGEGQFIYISNLSGTTLRYNKTDLQLNP